MKKILLASTLLGACMFFGVTAHASTNVYRLYNANTGEHFYTASLAEKNADVSAGWSYEGTGWISPNSGTPIYRVYNPTSSGDHYYTKSKYEATQLVKAGWRWDNNAKPVFYSGGSAKVYVAYNPHAVSGAHNFTTSSFEQNSLLKGGWEFGKVAWNAVGVGKPASVGMNTTQIKAGDFSSVQGKWRNANGNEITIKENQVIDSDGKTKTFINGFTDAGFPAYMIPDFVNGQQMDALAIIFVPRGKEVHEVIDGSESVDNSNVQKDRILIWGDAGAGYYFQEAPQSVYYKVN